MLLKYKEGTAIRFQNKDITFSNLFSKIHFVSNLFKVNKGDRVVVFSENRPGWIYAFYSAWQNGAIALPIDYLSSSKEVRYILEDSRPSAILYSKTCHDVLKEALKDTDLSPQLVEIDQFENKEVENNTQALNQWEEEQTAVIIYTSGTTGSPKGVMLSFKNILTNIRGVSEKVKIYTEDRSVMILLPLHHVFPLLGSCIAPLSLGAMVAIAPSLSPKDIIQTLNKNKIGIIIGVPRLYSSIRKGIMDKINANFFARSLFKFAGLIQSRHFSKMAFKTVHKKFGGAVKHMVSGGAALDKAVAQDFKTLGFDLLEGYGMTESSPMISFTRPGKLKVGSAGEVLQGTEMAIKDGEIVSRGDHIMQGYFNRPEETAEVIRDGWLHTGDLGTIDSKGRLFVTGRRKEIIVLSNGKNINPVELEFQLEKEMPYVKELAVFENNDKLQLIIVPDDVQAKKLGIEDVQAHTLSKVLADYNQAVSSYKKIYRLHISYEELPKTRLSKVQRFKLKEFINAPLQTKPDFSGAYTSQEFELIKQYIQEEKGIEVSPSDHVEFDLGLDSLEKVSLQVFMEHTFGVSISADKIAEHGTIQKLSEFVDKMKTRIHAEKVNWNDIVKEKVNIKLPRSHVSFWLAIKTLKILFFSYFRYRIRGKENIPKEPCIIAANHQSYLDGMLVASAFKSKTLMNSFFFAKAKHVRNRLFKFFARRSNIIVVDVNQDLKDSIQALATALRNGRNVVIFPEGTRSFTGDMGEFKKTFAILSKELDVPVVPVAICGSNRVLPRGKHFPKPLKKVTVEFLKPIFPKNHTYQTLTEATRSVIEKQLSLA